MSTWMLLDTALDALTAEALITLRGRALFEAVGTYAVTVNGIEAAPGKAALRRWAVPEQVETKDGVRFGFLHPEHARYATPAMLGQVLAEPFPPYEVAPFDPTWVAVSEGDQP